MSETIKHNRLFFTHRIGKRVFQYHPYQSNKERYFEGWIIIKDAKHANTLNTYQNEFGLRYTDK